MVDFGVPSTPHLPQPGADIDRSAGRGEARRGRPRRRAAAALEVVQDRRRDEPASRGVDVAVAVARLLVGEEALGHEELQFILGAGHGDVEQAALLLDLRGRSRRHVRGDAAVDGVEDVDGLPFLALGGMDGREDEVVLVEQGRAGFAAGGVRRIEGELGEEAFARAVAGGDLGEPGRIGRVVDGQAGRLSQAAGKRRNSGTARKVRITEGRLPMARRLELCAIEELGAADIGAGEVGTVEDGLEEIGRREICADQYCSAQNRAAQVRLPEIAPGKIGLGEVQAAQACAEEVGPCIRMRRPPFVPGMHALLQRREMCFVGHRLFLCRQSCWQSSICQA